MTEKKLTELPEKTQIAAMQKYIVRAFERQTAKELEPTETSIQLATAFALLTIAKRKGNEDS